MAPRKGEDKLQFFDFDNAKMLYKGDWAAYKKSRPHDNDCSIAESDNWKGAQQCVESWECRGARMCERGGWCSGFDGCEGSPLPTQSPGLSATHRLRVQNVVNEYVSGCNLEDVVEEVECLQRFATGMNSDEDLGQDITFKGEPYHFLQRKSDADILSALFGENVTRGALKNLVTDKPSPITTELLERAVAKTAAIKNIQKALTARILKAERKNIQKALTARILKAERDDKAATVATTAAIKNIQKALTARILKAERKNIQKALTARILKAERDADAAVAKTAAIKNIQKALTARILKRLDDGQPLVEVARKMKAIEGIQPQINDMERRLGIMQSVEPVLENAIKTLQKVVDVRGMGRERDDEVDHSGESFEAAKLGGGGYERIVTPRFAADTDDIFMRSMIKQYAPEGKNKDGSPNGKFWMDEAAARVAAAGVLNTHKGFSGEELDDYLKTYFPRAWAYFDVNKTGKIEVIKLPQFMRFLASDQQMYLW